MLQSFSVFYCFSLVRSCLSLLFFHPFVSDLYHLLCTKCYTLRTRDMEVKIQDESFFLVTFNMFLLILMVGIIITYFEMAKQVNPVYRMLVLPLALLLPHLKVFKFSSSSSSPSSSSSSPCLTSRVCFLFYFIFPFACASIG